MWRLEKKVVIQKLNESRPKMEALQGEPNENFVKSLRNIKGKIKKTAMNTFLVLWARIVSRYVVEQPQQKIYWVLER